MILLFHQLQGSVGVFVILTDSPVRILVNGIGETVFQLDESNDAVIHDTYQL